MMLEKVSSDNQSAFVPRIIINDNVVIAHECIHAIKKKRTGNSGSMALKLDVSKAYNRV